MQRGLLYLMMLIVAPLTYGQTCSSLTEPRNGAINIPVNTKISWSEIPGIIGFVVSFGTTPGEGDIIKNRSSGLNNFYIPETGLPADTQVYVTIGYYKAGQNFTICAVETFRTAKVTVVPQCTKLVEPLNGSANIAAQSKLDWNYAPLATGYLLSVGTTPNGTDVFDALDVGNVLSFEPSGGLPANRPIYATLTPYNDVGNAISCAEERFTTTAVVIDCGPFFDYKTGQTVSLGPKIDFPDRIGLCKDQSIITIESSDTADGYRWYALHLDGTETLLSSSRSVQLVHTGEYRYEAFNYVTRSTHTVECANSKLFVVNPSEIALISSIYDDRFSKGRMVKVNVTGDGDYEYALDNSEGTYQNSNVFENVSSEFHYIYVRDRNGCGISESSIQRNLSSDDFPKFFTPNGDNANDFWQYIPPKIEDEIVLTIIHIFDRYGHLLAVIDPESRGWDGTFAGRRLPSSDYWFEAIALNRQVVKGHFSLKR